METLQDFSVIGAWHKSLTNIRTQKLALPDAEKILIKTTIEKSSSTVDTFYTLSKETDVHGTLILSNTEVPLKERLMNDAAFIFFGFKYIISFIVTNTLTSHNLESLEPLDVTYVQPLESNGYLDRFLLPSSSERSAFVHKKPPGWELII